ncbi:MAG: hypothetical protein ACTSVY_00765, partial [Candidatus Helarchaeota archaeon]
TITVDQSLLSFAYGSTPPVLTWHPSDLHPSQFEILMNNSWIAGGQWAGGDIHYNISALGYNLPVGTHLFKLRVYDIDNNMANMTIVVRVTDSQPPVFGPVNFPTEIIEGTLITINVEVTDSNLQFVKIIYTYTLENGSIIGGENQILQMNPNPYPDFFVNLNTEVFNMSANITFMLTAIDTCGNVRNNTPYGQPYYLINVIRTPDNNPPMISDFNNATYGSDKDINITVNVSDDREIDRVWLNIWIYNTFTYNVTFYELEMTNLTPIYKEMPGMSTLYTCNISSSYFDENFTIFIDVQANDTAGNFATYSAAPIYLTVESPPIIHQPSETKGTNYLEVSIEIENADNALLYYQSGNDNWTSIAPIGPPTGNMYIFNITNTTYGNYYVMAKRTSGITSFSSTYWYYLGEYYSMSLTLPRDKIVGQYFSSYLTINNTSPFYYEAVVTLELPTNISLYAGKMVTHSAIMSGYSGIFDWKFVGTSPGDYDIIVNVNSTAFGSTSITETITIYQDNSPPQIDDVIYDETPGINESVMISTTIVDNVMVDKALIIWSSNSSLPFTQWNQSVMNLIGEYYVGWIPGQVEGTTVQFAIMANDTNGIIVVKNNYGLYFEYTVTSAVDIQIFAPSIVNQSVTFGVNVTINNKLNIPLDILITYSTTSTNLTMVSVPTGFIVLNDVAFGQTIIGIQQSRMFGTWIMNGTQVGIYNISVLVYNQSNSQILYSKNKPIQVIRQQYITGNGTGELEDFENDFNLNVSFRFPSNQSFEAWMSFFGTNPAGENIAGNASLVNGTGFYEFTADLPLIEGVLCIPFNMSEIQAQNIDPTTLQIAYFNEINQTWVPVPIGWLVHVSGDLWLACANISHFSFYAIIGEGGGEGEAPPPGEIGGIPEWVIFLIIIIVLVGIAAVAVVGIMRRRQQAVQEVVSKEKVVSEVTKEKVILPENQCAKHEGEIEGLKYTCVNCKTNYCLECAEKMLKDKEPCITCSTSINYYTVKKLIREQKKLIEEEKARKAEELKAQQPEATEIGPEKMEKSIPEKDKKKPKKKKKKKKKVKAKKKESEDEEPKAKNYYRLRRKKVKKSKKSKKAKKATKR